MLARAGGILPGSHERSHRQRANAAARRARLRAWRCSRSRSPPALADAASGSTRAAASARTQEELARRLRDIETDAREARSVARQAQEALREAQAKVGALEARLAESQSQQLALEALYQELSRNRDEWQLAEIEQVLAIASQQLQLAGNVRAALLALQLAEARLARTDRPQFLPVRRALARDIERLKALPALDLAGDELRASTAWWPAVDALPLAFEERSERAGAARSAPAAPERGFWSRLGAEVWGELRQLVVVRQVERARAAAAAAAAGLLPAREPAAAAAERAPVAADARRGRLPRGPARRAGLDPALLRSARASRPPTRWRS